MAANTKENGLKGSIVNLRGDGKNVREWEVSVLDLLLENGMDCLTDPEFAMYVDSKSTFSVGMSRQVERVINARRVTFMAQYRFRKAIHVKGESVAAQPGMPRLDPEVGSVSEKKKKKKKKKIEKDLRRSKRNEEKEKEEKEDDSESDSLEVNDDEQAEREFQIREEYMLAQGKRIAARQATEQSVATRFGTQRTYYFLDPLSALPLDIDIDRMTVCYEHTLDGETMRYAIETPEFSQKRMKIDRMIVTSLSAIPAHVCTDVVSGNVCLRHKSVVLFYDDVTHNTQVMHVTQQLNAFAKRTIESFSAFTSRYKTLEYNMQQQRMLNDPAVMFGRLLEAINGSADEDAKTTLWTLTTMGDDRPTTAHELLDAMKDPMRLKEAGRKLAADKNTKKEQEKVNAAFAWNKGGGGRGGKGGKGGSGAGKGKSERAKAGICLKFAQGLCERGKECHFEHKNLAAKEIAELKATLDKARAARAAKKASAPAATQQVRLAVPTAKTSTELKDQLAELQLAGFGRAALLEMSALLMKD
jgi:hypothetical protein